MSNWVQLDLNDPKTFPEQWERVLGYNEGCFEQFAIAYWYTDSGQGISWSWNGTSGCGILPPQMWKSIDHPEGL